MNCLVFASFDIRVLKKTLPVVTFLIVEGVKIIAQQCYTPCWKALDASFQVITELLYCVTNIPRYINENVRLREKD